MLRTDKLLFIHIQKTAGTSMMYCLQSAGLVDQGKHVPLREVKDHEDLVKFCTIRNPWDIHVSNFFFNINSGGKGWTIRDVLDIDPKKDINASNEREIFNAFIRKLYSGEYASENWKGLLLPEIGMCSADYINMCYTKDISEFDSAQEAIDGHDEYFGMQEVCRVENLYEDVVQLFDKYDIDIPVLLPRVNTSIHGNYRQYYEKDVIEIVAEKERLIIDKYGYTF